jgi:AraC family transcriptional regulator, transcriptional activator of the genes for pyochelin and ferripyochelin receptors
MVEHQPGLINVSDEMIAVVGNCAPAVTLTNAATLLVNLDRPASVRIFAASTDWRQQCGDRTIAMVVLRGALERLFAWIAEDADRQEFFLDATSAGIADQIIAARLAPEVQTTYRLGKSIELLCEITTRLQRGDLQPASRDLGLSRVDRQRLGTARAIIDEQWSEKLTIGVIARRAGLNRTKLSRGFRELYRCSVGEALADRRLAEARRQLLATDLPVSVIGYRTGYSNNASFSRAFGRRFGLSPSELRNSGVAA